MNCASHLPRRTTVKSPDWHSAAHGGAFGGVLVWMLLLMLSAPAVAQPALEITDLVVNWPSIEVYFTAECDGIEVWDAGKENLTLRENGEEIPDYMLWCPDPVPTAVSVSLVLDISAAMDPLSRDSAVNALRTFVAQMDGVKDEAELLQFNQSVQVRQAMTTDTTLLQAALSGLTYDADAFLWDGIHAGIIEQVLNGLNPARAVIVMTAGIDQGSTRTQAEVLSVAARNRIPVHIIALDAGADTASLAQLAAATGGSLLHARSPAGLEAHILDILDDMRFLFWGKPECVISYPRTRADGTLREVELTFKDYCDSAATARTSYRAPFIAESMLDVVCPDTLRLSYDSQSGLYSPNPFTITVPYRNLSSMPLSNLQGAAISMSANVLVAPGKPSVQQHPGGILAPWQEGDTLTSFTWEFLFGGITPCLDQVHKVLILMTATDTALTPVEIECNAVIVVEGAAPELGEFTLASDGPTEFCFGDSLVLDAGPDAQLYFWSNGASTRRITVKESGSYFCEAVAADCDRGFSDTVVVTVYPAAFTPAIMRDRDVLRSTEEQFYQWLRNGQDIPGATQRTYALTETGTYQVRVTNQHGCTALSDPYEVTVLSVDAASPADFRLDVYPQPARDAVTVMLRGWGSGVVTINLYDQLGRRMLKREVELYNGALLDQIDVGSLNRGIHVLEVRGDAQRRSRLLLLE